jgi:hypothetical protein
VTGVYGLTLPGYIQMAGPSVVYVTSDCDDLATACVGQKDFFDGQAALQVSLVAGTTYFVIVDSYGMSEIGPFTILLEQL